jgi:sulfite reductase (NADPH) hemoprotein beta-component
MTAKVLTANRLIDGDVVYFTAAGAWDTRIEESRIATTKDEAAALDAIGAQAVADQLVVAPYLIEVAEEAGGITPLRYREHIRAYGPSNRPDLAKHAKAG